MRELTKVIDINGETYRVRKMNALDGACLFKEVIEKFLPMLTRIGELTQTPDGSPVDTDAQTMNALTSMLSSFSSRELKKLMQDCLQYAEKSLAAGWARVMRDGDFEVPELEYDTATCLQLVKEEIVWNFSDFFGENGLNLSQFLPNTGK